MLIWIFTSVIFAVGTILSIICTDWTEVTNTQEIRESKMYAKLENLDCPTRHH